MFARMSACACQPHKAKTTAGVLPLVLAFTNIYPSVSRVSQCPSKTSEYLLLGVPFFWKVRKRSLVMALIPGSVPSDPEGCWGYFLSALGCHQIDLPR